jgi:hypothetical protein
MTLLNDFFCFNLIIRLITISIIHYISLVSTKFCSVFNINCLNINREYDLFVKIVSAQLKRYYIRAVLN